MKPTLAFTSALLALAFGACVHTPPHTAVQMALAKKAELVRLSTPPPLPGAPIYPATAPGVPSAAPSQVPSVEPPLPEGTSSVERVGEAYSRGTFCLEAGNDVEAIAAFEEAVHLDPTFTDAWQNLAMLYEKKGQEKKALDAFKRAKKLAKK